MAQVIMNEIRCFLRSGSTMFFTVFFPCACVFFLGTFLESVEVSDQAVGELKILYSTEQGDPYAVSALEEFLKSLEDEGMLSAEKGNTDQIQTFDIKAYSAGIELNQNEIIIHKGKDKIKNRAVKAIFDSYSQTAAAYNQAVMVNPEILTQIKDLDQSFVKSKDFGKSRSMMDYYAVTMAVMILFMGSCIGGSGVYANEHEWNTMQRLDGAPLSKTALYFGKIIGSLPMVLLQIGSVMFVSTFLFKAHYCNHLLDNLLLVCLFISASLAALSVGVLLNLFLPNVLLVPVLMPVLWIGMFFSGTFAMDIQIKGLTEYMPMYMIQRAAFDLTVFSRREKALFAIVVSICMFIVMLIIGWIKVNINRNGGSHEKYFNYIKK